MGVQSSTDTPNLQLYGVRYIRRNVMLATLLSSLAILLRFGGPHSHGCGLIAVGVQLSRRDHSMLDSDEWQVLLRCTDTLMRRHLLQVLRRDFLWPVCGSLQHQACTATLSCHCQLQKCRLYREH